MPHKDPAKRREYQKEYRRRKRSEKKVAVIEAVSGDVQKPVKPPEGPPHTVADVLAVVGRQIHRLETDPSLDPILAARAISPLATVFINATRAVETEAGADGTGGSGIICNLDLSPKPWEYGERAENSEKGQAP